MSETDPGGVASTAEPLLRFDSLDPGRGAECYRFGAVREVVRADQLEQVLPALARVQAAVAEGLHAAGFVAYEAASAFDPALVTRPAQPGTPLLWFALCARREAVAPPPAPRPGSPAAVGVLRPSLAEPAYRDAVGRIRELIGAGDSYQVNFTFRLRGAYTGPAEELYRRLCHAQRAAFCACIDYGEGVLLSASPELFFRWRGDELELRPMKGTRPRGRWLEEDAALERELHDSPKDRAENLMIVDLLRNDAGRVAEFGSVRVAELYAVERYPTVLQLTSTVRARTRPGITLSDVFRALFPCGSVTGAPKVRTSAIIAELEDSPRGVYTGAIGFVSPDEAVFSVAIRTLQLDPVGAVAELGVGSGVTWGSDAAAEYRECLDKAEFVYREPPPGLLETLRWEPAGGYRRLDRHLTRLGSSAAYFGYPLDVQGLRAELERQASQFPPEARRVRIELAPGGEVQITHSPAPQWEEPVLLVPAPRQGESGHPFWYHKTTARERYRPRDGAVGAGETALLVNERGELAETAIANLVVELEGKLWTPALECGVLPGVLRGELLEAGTVRERVLYPDDLARASRLWVINSLRGWGRAELADGTR